MTPFALAFDRGLRPQVLLQKFVPEFTLWIVLPQQLLKIGVAFIACFQLRRWNREQLAPMWTRAKFAELFFDQRQQAHDFVGVLFPGEVNCNAGAFVSGAHPKIVGGDGADFGDKQVLNPFVAEAVDGFKRSDGVTKRDEVFGLQFLATAGREIHFEMRQPFVPGAGHAHLIGAIF